MSESRTIAVSGVGVATDAPDRCLVSLAITVMRNSAGEAVHDVAELAEAVVRAVRDTGVPSADIRTQNVSVQDWFDPQERRVTARVGSYQLVVSNRQLDELGSLLNELTAVAGDSLRVNGVMLTFSDPEPLRVSARQAAVEDATAKARQLADASGLRLGDVIAIEEGIAPGFGRLVARTAALQAQPGPPQMPIEGGDQAITVRVTIVFAID